MNNQYAVLRNKAIGLAKKLKRPVEDVPQVFQILELEQYVNDAEAEVARRAK